MDINNKEMIRSAKVAFVLLVCLGFCCQRLAGQKATAADTSLITVYLSFDDGPVKESRYLDSLILKDTVPVNVFVIGNRALAGEEMSQRLAMYKKSPVIEIGNHSYTHAADHFRRYYAEPDKVVRDMIRNTDSLQLLNKLARLPGRNTWRVNGRKRTDLADADPAADSLSKLGYAIIGWDIEWRFDTALCRYYSAREMINLTLHEVKLQRTFEKRHVVILCHDWALMDDFFRSQLQVFIRAIKRGKIFRFSGLSGYPGVGTF